MLRLIVALCFLIACLAQNLQKTRLLFNEYKQQYQKTYSGAENEYRLQVFSENLDFINRHNEEADRGLHTYRCGVNKYADMSHEEFVRVMLGFRHNANATYTNKLYVPQISDEALPAEVDWRKKGFVTHIKDQGQCGSCWAFSATGSLEGQHYNRTKKLVSLSEQNLVDCSQKEGNMGCLGGLMDQAFKYIKTNHGIDTEKSYPYKAEDEKCRFKKGEVGATLKSWRDIPKGSEKALEKAVAEVGPISVAIDASQTSFQLYSTGVYNEPACSKDVLDHGVLAIGYGVEKSKDFWLVKNSWGTSWGEEGYIKMSRNKNNQCGIATEASHPVV